MDTLHQSARLRSPGEILIDFFSVVARRKRHLAIFVISVSVVTAVITLVLPKWYKATASVFPAENADLFGGLNGISSLVNSFSPAKKLSSLTGGSEMDRYTAILKSERA